MNNSNSSLPAIVSDNLVCIVQGRYVQQDGTWFELAGEDSFVHYRYCPCCGAIICKVRGRWEECGYEEV